MEICDIPINGDKVEITFCNDEAEDVMTIKITKKDAEQIKQAIEREDNINIDLLTNMKSYYCSKCKGYTYDVDYCDNPSCPNMPCCGKPKELCDCEELT